MAATSVQHTLQVSASATSASCRRAAARFFHQAEPHGGGSSAAHIASVCAQGLADQRAAACVFHQSARHGGSVATQTHCRWVVVGRQALSTRVPAGRDKTRIESPPPSRAPSLAAAHLLDHSARHCSFVAAHAGWCLRLLFALYMVEQPQACSISRSGSDAEDSTGAWCLRPPPHRAVKQPQACSIRWSLMCM